MFGISLMTLATHAAAAVGGVVSWSFLSAAYTKVKTAVQADDATLKARIAALEAALKAQAPAQGVAPAPKPSAPPTVPPAA
jgi:hypothetical protein